MKDKKTNKALGIIGGIIGAIFMLWALGDTDSSSTNETVYATGTVNVRKTYKTGTTAIYNLDLDIHYKSLNKEFIQKVHQKGIKVNCWTVDIKEDAEALIEMGVDMITSNILE